MASREIIRNLRQGVMGLVLEGPEAMLKTKSARHDLKFTDALRLVPGESSI